MLWYRGTVWVGHVGESEDAPTNIGDAAVAEACSEREAREHQLQTAVSPSNGGWLETNDARYHACVRQLAAGEPVFETWMRLIIEDVVVRSIFCTRDEAFADVAHCRRGNEPKVFKLFPNGERVWQDPSPPYKAEYGSPTGWVMSSPEQREEIVRHAQK